MYYVYMAVAVVESVQYMYALVSQLCVLLVIPFRICTAVPHWHKKATCWKHHCGWRVCITPRSQVSTISNYPYKHIKDFRHIHLIALTIGSGPGIWCVYHKCLTDLFYSLPQSVASWVTFEMPYPQAPFEVGDGPLTWAEPLPFIT